MLQIHTFITLVLSFDTKSGEAINQPYQVHSPNLTKPVPTQLQRPMQN
jgi:hypothetical protein